MRHENCYSNSRPLILICVFVYAIGLSSGDRERAAADERPNIIFLMADDQCTYSMGCYGTPRVKTPNLDRLAGDGMIFDRHYVSTAICMASRANVMTGLVEYKHGCNFMHGPLLNKHWKASYPVLLKSAGYVTGFAGKFGFEVSSAPGKRGVLPESDFDWWGGGPGQTHYRTSRNKSMERYAQKYPHSTRAYGAFGADFIKEFANQDKPFCLSISFKAPHRPVEPDPTYNRVYEGVKFVKPKNYGRQYGEHFSLQSRQGRQFERFHSWGYSSDYDAVMAKYYQQIFAIDVAVGMIRKALVESKCEKNTVIIYTSDNGFMCGSHGYGSKVLPYEESSRVPLIILDPRHPNSGKKIRCGELTSNIDFAPTILSLAGVKSPKVDGRDLTKLYASPQKPIHDYVPLVNVWGPQPTFSLSVVTRDSKFIRWPYENEKMKPREELYDLQSDPMELTNLLAVQESGTGAPIKKLADEMKTKYQQVVDDWNKSGVRYHKYDIHEFFSRK